MKKTMVLVVLCFTLSLPALCQQNPADQPATQADVERYLNAVHSRDMMNQMVDAMSKPMHNFIHEQYLKDQDKLPADFEAKMSKMMDDMLKNIPWDDIMRAMLPAYQKHFTKGDMDALTAFYTTPTGQKILREMPALMADSMEIMMPMIRSHIERVSDKMQAEVDAMMKESSKPAHSNSTVKN